MQVIQYDEWIEQTDRQVAQQIALLVAQNGVDGIVDADNLAAFPAAGVEGLLYLAKDTGKLYSWNATAEEYVRIDEGTDYILPTATDVVLGGVKVGTGLAIADGVLSYTLPTAAVDTLGGVKVGTGLAIVDGVLSATPYTLPVATDLTLGGITVGTGLSVTAGGVLSVNKLQNVTTYIGPHAIAASDEIVIGNADSLASYSLNVDVQGQTEVFQIMKSGVFAGTAVGNVDITITTSDVENPIVIPINDGETIANGLTIGDIQATALNTDYTVIIPTEGDDAGKIVLTSRVIGAAAPLVPGAITIGGAGTGITIDGGASGSFTVTTEEIVGLQEVVSLIVPDTAAPGTITLTLDGNAQTIEATEPLTQDELIDEIMLLEPSYPAWTFSEIAGGVQFTSVAFSNMGVVSISMGTTLDSYILSLPSAVNVGKMLKIKNVGTLPLNVALDGSDVIEGSSVSVGLAQYEDLSLLCYETGKWCKL